MSERQERDFDGPPPGNPDANQLSQAERVMAQHPELRYAPGLGWLHWDGTKWAEGGEARMRNAVMANAKRQVAIAPALPFNQLLASRRGLEDVASIAQNLPGVHVEASELDTHLDRIHTAGTTWHLGTGAAWPTDPAELNTRAVNFDPASGCPEWLATLDRCFPDAPETVSYLQRLIGYGITGHVSEQAFILMHGGGANGKSTFINVLTHVFREYVEHVPVEVLMNTSQRNGEAPSPMLMKIRGARLVFTSETERGGRLNEPMVKLLTGGDEITARALHRDPVTFKPEALIFMATNHLPEIRGTDDGIWRRVKLLEWKASFKGREDKGIEDRLKAEAPGILSWALDGALEWYRAGKKLNEPDSVRLSTEDMRKQSDFLGSFIPEWLVADDDSWLPRSEVKAVWDEFCEANGAGANVIQHTATLYRALEERGAVGIGRKGVRGYRVRRAR